MVCCGRRATVHDRDHPVLIGNPNDELVRARATVGLVTVHSGETAWFTGDGVAAMVAGGMLVIVA